jgi:hypothetical protein
LITLLAEKSAHQDLMERLSFDLFENLSLKGPFFEDGLSRLYQIIKKQDQIIFDSKQEITELKSKVSTLTQENLDFLFKLGTPRPDFSNSGINPSKNSLELPHPKRKTH